MMLLHRLLPTLLLVAAATGCADDDGRWYRGNLHTHTFWSDGDDFPEMVIAWYADSGYDFIALSDHNTTADTERWIRIDERRRPAFDQYMERFGDGWVESRQRGDTLEARLRTFDEYSDLFDRPGTFLVIHSEEISDGFEGKPLHVNATNIRDYIEPQHGSSVTDVLQRNIDAVLAQRDSTGVPMVPHVNHPNFGWAVTPDDMVPLDGEHFFEVYNGHPLVRNEGGDGRPGTEALWDYVNAKRLAQGRSLLYGLAVDDAHSYHQDTLGLANPGRGWIMVRAKSLTPGALIDAMERGAFYATSGIVLDELEFEDGRLEIAIRPDSGVTYVTTFVGSRRVGPDSVAAGVVFDRKEGVNPVYLAGGDELFVRASIVSDKPMKNPYMEGETERAWTQPVRPGMDDD